jgi:hypothetical protein
MLTGKLEVHSGWTTVTQSKPVIKLGRKRKRTEKQEVIALEGFEINEWTPCPIGHLGENFGSLTAFTAET